MALMTLPTNIPTKSWDVSKRWTNVGERHGSNNLYKIRSLVAFGERRRMSTNAGGSSMWWAFLDTYRTLCLAPTPEVREIFEKLRTEHLVDLRL